MLPIERVFNLLQGKPTDRVPFAPLTSLYGAGLISCALNEYFVNPKKYLQGQMAVTDSIEPDILFTPFALVLEAKAFGSKTTFFEKNPPNLVVPSISGIDGISGLALPNIEKSPDLMYLVESTRLLSEQYKNQIPVAAIVNAPTELPALIMGIENWIDTLLFHPQEALQLMELTSAHFVNFANTLLSAGATCIVAPASFSNPTIITYQIAKNVLVPQMRIQFAKINGPIVFHHGGARLLPFLDLLQNMPNVIGYVLDPRDNFTDVRTIIGKDPLVMGNFNGPLLLKSNAKTVETICTTLLESMKHDDKFVLATSNADIPFDTPLDNLKTISKTIKNYLPGK